MTEELKEINRFTRRELSEEDVYIFSVVLCDNEIDRDYERFSDEALETLAKMFVGVTGIADHEPTSSNQSARIFSCRVEAPQGQLTSDGKAYRRLCARAYLPRSEKTQDMILALDSGIKKEVSVGCAVKQRICSICGEDIAHCQHRKGQEYGGRLCYATLHEPTDAYEWSFVAVPAQKEAGVIKGLHKGFEAYHYQGGVNLTIEKKLFSEGEQHFTEEERQELAKLYLALQQKAQDGEMVRKKLTEDITGLSAIVLPCLCVETVRKMTEGLSVAQLDEMKNAFESKAAEKLPLRPQLYRPSETSANHNDFYQNI